MPSPPAAVELLTTLAPVLARWGRWYLFGAQAVILNQSDLVSTFLAIARPPRSG